MKLSLEWLRALAPQQLDANTLAERLTLAGLEVEEQLPAAPPLEGVVVARILEATQHPNADRLRVCRVDAGTEEPLQIVCGAPNARAGLTVALATVNTRLPGDFKIKKSKIRGEVSLGMLCAAEELGLELPGEGILELPDTLTPGTPFSEALGLDDTVLDIALTPNRGDCLSVLGVARELAALELATLQAPACAPAETASTAQRMIVIADPPDCSWYCGRVIEDLDPQARTPLWMAERLRRSGLRPRNPLVDVTNYVLLELGQPLHAFDDTCLDGEIRVRRAQAGEALTLLDGSAVTLSPADLVIADARGAQALAGAMGGADSAVGDATTRVFLESACFSPLAVAGLGRRHKLHSDALHRFERGTDPALPQRALERATALLLEICGGRAGPITQAGSAPGPAPAITLDLARSNAILGTAMSPEQAQGILAGLGCVVAAADGTLTVQPPSWRRDLAIPEDLMEELARIAGYDQLGGEPSRVRPQFLIPPAAPRQLARARALLQGRGWAEAQTFAFASADAVRALSGAEPAPALRLANPISEQLTDMRPTLWASLLPVYAHNLRHGNRDLRLFEAARVFRDDAADGDIREIEMLAGMASGRRHPESWARGGAELDFADMRGLIEALGALAGSAGPLDFVAADHPALQPGQSARVERDGQPLGWVGRMHPRIARTLDLGEKGPLLFELEREALLAPQRRPVAAPAPYPASRRDLSFLVPTETYVGDMLKHMTSNTPVPLRELLVFDVFSDDSLDEGFKSVAFGLIFQDFSRTLTDGVIDDAVASLVEGLESRFQARLRD